ncbi:amine oxidase [Collybia nuda]|uniref:Amine oxidase n=1 Tax=Collybia nuda TaxID=64659 RepID=A0A9P5XTP7_9AGAR|nr:amine oxidase [Collybia nuda]
MPYSRAWHISAIPASFAMVLLQAHFLILLAAVVFARGFSIPQADHQHRDTADKTVLILGGGVAGVIAARTLHERGIKDFIIIEGRNELGGRLRSTSFGGKTVELGANWVQGTQTDGGPANPILTLVKKHKVQTQFNDYFGSLTTYDKTGPVDFLDVFNASVDAFTELTVAAGPRVSKSLVDLTSRGGYTLTGVRPRDAHAKAAEYFNFDWEYAQKPDQSSWVASSWNNNFTYDVDQGGFSEDNLLAIDQRGFKAFIQEEAKEFLDPSQIMLNAIVKTVSWSGVGVTVVLEDGRSISGDYALCTFSLGVLQNDDVVFKPSLPDWKQEAIASMTMGTYTKIFLQFPENFWFDTEMGLYADPERGRYPVWQSLDHESFLPGSGIIFATVTGDYSERIEALSDTQVKAEVLGVLYSMFPNVTVPDPLDFMFPRWFSDPLYRGSYSNWPPSFFREHHDNLRANLGRLFFAGEATSQKYFGFLHGAYFEGLNVGQELVKCIKGKGCVGLKHSKEVKNTSPYGI